MQHIDEQYIVNNFESALEKGYVKAYYQPVIRTLTERICSVEALARWQDPVVGLLSPFLFINVLEKYRLIHKLDLAILDNICITYNEMRERGLPLHPFSINLSRLDFDEIDMLDAISKILDKHNVPSTAIHIEITESVMLDNTAYFRRIFDSFHDAGFAIFMDDFGSGYSSLNVLKDYSFDVLKIDMRFLSDIGIRSKKILASVMNMAKAIGMHTLAEGVETKEQMTFLRNIGCEMLQGFYYSKPMDSSLYIEYLSKSKLGVEDPAENHYWNSVGQINFLSPDPLNDLTNEQIESGDYGFIRENSTALALIEQTDAHVELLYKNEAYEKGLQRIGFKTVDDMIKLINDNGSSNYSNVDSQVKMTIKTGDIIKEDHLVNGIYFTYCTKCIAEGNGKVMLAASIQTYGGEADKLTTDLFDKYSRMLIDTYDHISVIDPAKNLVLTRLYSKLGFNEDYPNLPLDEAIKQFAENEVAESDRKRFLKCMEPSTLRDRMKKSGARYFQLPFSFKTQSGEYKMMDTRLTRVFMTYGDVYIFSIEEMSEQAHKAAEIMLDKHPEFFEII
ncbi:EAL domain-containing protein [Ruminococcus sp.]|uniref:EAL domain-containing protein n=1 Tax=Ruminococcus sp. TaxID=41978 RepID=UPI0025DA24A6|nr:EAL domain-containing protein [Ruminococcus sp.]MCR4639234.1 EAL domain-containing protein [Ruminococcus sp.]